MRDEELDTEKLMKIVSHPVRIRIIELLDSKGPLSWKELSGELGVRTGALYYHIDTLERIVTRDAEKRYALTKVGEAICAYLNENRVQSPEGLEKAIRRRSTSGAVTGVFVPRSLIAALSSTTARAAASIALFSALVVSSLLFSGSELILFSFRPSSGLLLSVATYLGSLGAVAGVSLASVRLAFRQRAEPVPVLVSSALSFVPLAAFGAVLRYLDSTGALGALSGRAGLTIVFSFFQAWGAGVVAGGMSVSSGLRVEKTLMVSLVMLYATMMIVFLQGGSLA